MSSRFIHLSCVSEFPSCFFEYSSILLKSNEKSSYCCTYRLVYSYQGTALAYWGWWVCNVQSIHRANTARSCEQQSSESWRKSQFISYLQNIHGLRRKQPEDLTDTNFLQEHEAAHNGLAYFICRISVLFKGFIMFHCLYVSHFVYPISCHLGCGSFMCFAVYAMPISVLSLFILPYT